MARGSCSRRVFVNLVLKICIYLFISGAGKAKQKKTKKEIKNSLLSAGSLSNCLPQAKAELRWMFGAGNSVSVSCIGARDPVTCAIPAFFQGLR